MPAAAIFYASVRLRISAAENPAGRKATENYENSRRIYTRKYGGPNRI